MAKQPQTESIADMFSNLGHALPIPDMDVDRIIDHHRKNLEALEQSARAGGDGATQMLNRQREMIEEQIRRAMDHAKGFKMPGSPQEMMSSQVDFARRAFETAVQNASEMARLAQDSSTQSVDILRERIRTAMGELTEGFNKPR